MKVDAFHKAEYSKCVISSLCPASCEDLGDVPGPLRSPLKQTEIFKGVRATLLIIFEQDWEPGGVVNIKVSVVFVSSSLKIGDTPWQRLEIESSVEFKHYRLYLYLYVSFLQMTTFNKILCNYQAQKWSLFLISVHSFLVKVENICVE